MLKKLLPKEERFFDLFQKIEDVVPLKINKEYLNLLFKAYHLRYPDDLKMGYNIALNKTKLLVELDYTVSAIRKGFSNILWL